MKTTTNDYLKFLESKQKNHIQSGFKINENELNNNLFDFQKFIVKRALKAGKYAIFADCGLDRKSTRLNSSHVSESRMPSSA